VRCFRCPTPRSSEAISAPWSGILTSLPGDPALTSKGRSVDEAREMLELAGGEGVGATVDSLAPHVAHPATTLYKVPLRHVLDGHVQP
jgi:hypothetical protein